EPAPHAPRERSRVNIGAFRVETVAAVALGDLVLVAQGRGLVHALRVEHPQDEAQRRDCLLVYYATPAETYVPAHRQTPGRVGIEIRSPGSERRRPPRTSARCLSPRTDRPS